MKKYLNNYYYLYPEKRNQKASEKQQPLKSEIVAVQVNINPKHDVLEAKSIVRNFFMELSIYEQQAELIRIKIYELKINYWSIFCLFNTSNWQFCNQDLFLKSLNQNFKLQVKEYLGKLLYSQITENQQILTYQQWIKFLKPTQRTVSNIMTGKQEKILLGFELAKVIQLLNTCIKIEYFKFLIKQTLLDNKQTNSMAYVFQMQLVDYKMFKNIFKNFGMGSRYLFLKISDDQQQINHKSLIKYLKM